MAEQTGSERWRVDGADWLSIGRHAAVTLAAVGGYNVYAEQVATKLSPEEQAALIGLAAGLVRFVWRFVRRYAK